MNSAAILTRSIGDDRLKRAVAHMMLQDFLTSSYLMTAKDVFYTREEFGQLVAYMGDALDVVALPPPAIVLPQELWTGKQLFSLLVRPNARESG